MVTGGSGQCLGDKKQERREHVPNSISSKSRFPKEKEGRKEVLTSFGILYGQFFIY